MSDDNSTISTNLIPWFILRDNISGIKFRINFHIADNLYRIVSVKYFYVIFGSLYHNTDLIFGGFYEIIFFQIVDILLADCFTFVDLEIFFVHTDGVFVVCPDLYCFLFDI